MLHKRAYSIQQVLNALANTESNSVKVASGDECRQLQKTAQDTAYLLYDVMTKTAADYCSDVPEGPVRITKLVEKIAQTLGKPRITNETLLKIAAAVEVDNALKDTTDPKLAEAKLYGREYFVTLLREVF